MCIRDRHYDALNRALAKVDEKYVITREEHLSAYDGLPTTRKLELLTEKKGLPVVEYDTIWQDKQTATLDIFSELKPDYELMHYFQQLKDKGYNIAVACNSVRNTVKLVLLRLGLLEFVHYYLSLSLIHI